MIFFRTHSFCQNLRMHSNNWTSNPLQGTNRIAPSKKSCQTDHPPTNQPAIQAMSTYITVDMSVRPPVDIAQKDILQVFLAQQVEPQSLHWQGGCSVAAKSQHTTTWHITRAWGSHASHARFFMLGSLLFLNKPLAFSESLTEQSVRSTHTNGVFSAFSNASSLDMGFPEMISSVRPGMKLSGGPENRSSRACIMASQRSSRRITACSMGETMGSSADTRNGGYMLRQWGLCV